MRGKILSFLLIGCLVFAFSCAKKKAKVTEVPEREKGCPNWVPLPGEVTTYDEAIAKGEVIQGIGFSPAKANPRLTRDAAIADALAKLAEQTEVHISKVLKDVFGEWQDALQKDLTTSINETKQMIKTIVDTKIQGPFPMQEYIEKETGNCWVRMLLSAAVCERWLKEKLKMEATLRRLFIEAKCKQIAEELQKDIDNLREVEAKEKAQIEAILRGEGGSEEKKEEVEE
jgi:hypothetical protein